MIFAIKKPTFTVIDGTHSNFEGTDLENAPIEIVIGNDLTRTETFKRMMEAGEGISMDKFNFMTYVKKSNIKFQNEMGEVIEDEKENLELLYEDQNSVPKVLQDTIFEEIKVAMGEEKDKKKEIENSTQTMQDGEQDTHETV